MYFYFQFPNPSTKCNLPPSTNLNRFKDYSTSNIIFNSHRDSLE